MKKLFNFCAVILLSFVINGTAIAQCKSIVKDGIKKLAPYTHNGQVNNVTIKGGKPAEIHLSFYKGLYYKLQIVSEQSLGKVTFRVLDENKKEVYNSSTEEKDDFWNFYSNSSQELVIEVTPTEKNEKGCVAVLVGMQVPKHSSNPIRNL